MAQLAARVNWSLEQVLNTPLDVTLLCERLGWKGPEGFARLQRLPYETVKDWLVIAELEREKEERARSR